MNVSLQIRRELDVPVPVQTARALLQDPEAMLRRFPKLKRLKAVSPGAWLSELETIGSRIAKIQHDVAFAATYATDPAKGELSWKPLKKYGNAEIEGLLKVSGNATSSKLSIKVEGTLRDVPVPLVYRMLAAPFIQGKFTQMVDLFLQRHAEALGVPAA